MLEILKLLCYNYLSYKLLLLYAGVVLCKLMSFYDWYYTPFYTQYNVLCYLNH